ncbi:vWA domain-containing protein [Synechococcus lacustris]|uniref:vWA domain-containing protein n=1 Tax=Synechococcus lacustris TaxID=2116544 RepID=UPI0020CF6328|nr:VWA domain-containing protein [Synechococcus lacustris]
MAGQKLQAACKAAQQLANQLTADDLLTVISFDHQVQMVVPLGAPSELTSSSISQIRAGGQTALFDGWSLGMQTLLQAKEINGYQKRILLLTDGQANVGLRRCSEIAPLVGQAAENGISTSCIGLGDDYEERLLTAMAEAGSGNLVHLTSPQQLEAIFRAELEGLNLTIGRNLQMRVQLAQGVRLKQIYNLIEPNINSWIPLGSIQLGLTPSLAIKLAIEPTMQTEQDLYDLLTVEAKWINMDNNEENMQAVLRLPVIENQWWDRQPRDPDVNREVLLQKAAQERRQAMEGIDQGDILSSSNSIKTALYSLAKQQNTPEIERERQLLDELLELISTDKYSLARKVMGTQLFMRARGKKLRNQDGSDDN